MAESKTIRWEQDSDGIVTLTLDDPKSTYGIQAKQRIDELKKRVQGTAPK